MTTHITYENGRLDIATANGTHIGFRVCDLQYKDRVELIRAVADITPVQQAGDIGFLKTQPVEERERVLEEVLGIPLSELLGGDDDE
jgi:hypothetical protein